LGYQPKEDLALGLTTRLPSAFNSMADNMNNNSFLVSSRDFENRMTAKKVH
jgi:hypothetical protein